MTLMAGERVGLSNSTEAGLQDACIRFRSSPWCSGRRIGQEVQPGEGVGLSVPRRRLTRCVLPCLGGRARGLRHAAGGRECDLRGPRRTEGSGGFGHHVHGRIVCGGRTWIPRRSAVCGSAVGVTTIREVRLKSVMAWSSSTTSPRATASSTLTTGARTCSCMLTFSTGRAWELWMKASR